MHIPDQSNNIIQLRSGISIFPSQDRAIDRILGELYEKSTAKLILLTDITGQIVSVRGDRGKIDLVALGSLSAGDLAASREMARLSEEYQQDQMILREGSKTNTLIYEAGVSLVLMMQVSTDVPLGWARMLASSTAHEIAKVIEQKPTELEQRENTPEKMNGNDILSNLDSALGDIWKE
jgi:predicted regulator of Ras-like GTPase activity (Roadblock/LC7/MglB family)